MKIQINISKLFTCTLLVGGFIASFATPASAVWINEFHYDNLGTDADEFIEVAGASGTDLTGYKILLYNGSDGGSYRTINLSGIIDNESNGYGALDFAAVGIQNGAPDGFALVNGTTVIQFLSYEGSFAATAGAANGLISTDVGVIEKDATVGHSLQLTGNGLAYNNFTWSAPALGSQGSINAGQTFPTPISNVPDVGSSALLLSLALGCFGLASKCCIRVQACHQRVAANNRCRNC